MNSGRFLRLGRHARAHLWSALPLMFAVATAAVAAPPTGPIQRIFSPTPRSDPWLDVLPLEKATEQPLREPRGIHAGGFIVLPRLEISEEYSDNIFATKNNRESDFVTIVSPSISAESTWSRHGLGVRAFGQFNRYAEHGTENSEEAGINQTGRLDINADDYISEFLSFSREAQDRSETDDTGSRRPPIFYRYVARTRYAHQFNDFEIRLDSQLQRFEYVEDFDFDRDRVEFRVGPRLSYRMSPYLTPFVGVNYQDRNFDSAVNRSGVDADSHTYDAIAGFGFVVSPTLTGEVAGGVFHTDFDDSSLDPVTSGLVDATLYWEVTRLTTITGEISRREAATSTSTNSSKIVSSASLRIDHELMRNVLLGGGIRYRNEDFQDIDREDNRFDVEIGGTYLINPYASVSLDYNYSNRQSNVDAGDFTENSVLLSLGLKM